MSYIYRNSHFLNTKDGEQISREFIVDEIKFNAKRAYKPVLAIVYNDNQKDYYMLSNPKRNDFKKWAKEVFSNPSVFFEVIKL